MSWSVSCMGLPENVAAYLDKYSETQSGQSKVEYDEAKPSLIALVKQNFNTEGNTPIVTLTASGSGYSREGTQISRNCAVKLEVSYAKLV